jgi:pimeloyl-ACP methyl ester carboxylesterase
MRRRTGLLLGVGALAAVAVAVARALRAAAVETDDDLTLPEDVRTHTVASHDGGSIHVLERGSGRPLVLLHGISLGAEIWAYQLRDLAASFRVLAPEWRGHGRSVAGDEGYGLELLAHDLATVLEQLDLRGAIVVGHSMGGMVLMRFLADHPAVAHDRVAGLVFLSTAADSQLPRAVAGVADVLGRRAMAGGQLRAPVPAFADRLTPHMPLVAFRRAFGARPVPAHIAHTRAVMAGTPARAAMSSGFGMLAHDGAAALRAAVVPALVVVGSRDLVTPPAAARRIADLLPHGRLVVLDGGGHQLMLERRRELADLLRDLAGEVA